MIDLSPSHPALCMLKMALASCSPEQDEDYVAEPITHIIFSLFTSTLDSYDDPDSPEK